MLFHRLRMSVAVAVTAAIGLMSGLPVHADDNHICVVLTGTGVRKINDARWDSGSLWGQADSGCCSMLGDESAAALKSPASIRVTSPRYF